MRRVNSLESDTSSQAQRLRVASPSQQEAQDGYNAKLTDLASFDSCVEACDALAASSSLAQSSATQDDETGLQDCSVVVSPDGDLLLLPQKPAEAQPKLQEATATGAPPSAESISMRDTSVNTTISLADSIDTDTAPTPPELDEPVLTLNDEPRTPLNKKKSLDFLEQPSDDYASAIIMGNDLQPGGDRAINGFSAMGWSAAATSLAVRQTEQTLRQMSQFVQNVVTSGKEHSSKTARACDNLRMQAGIGALQEQSHLEFPPTPLPAGLRDQNVKKRMAQTIDLNSLSDLEPIGSSWKNNFANPQSLEIATHRVGPLLYSGSSIYSAMIALEQYHQLTAEKDAQRWKKATIQGGVLPSLNKTAEQTAERAYHREKALKDMQRRCNDMEQHLGQLKVIAKKRWQAVYHGEESVTRILEERMMERSRNRERHRMEQLRREHEENEQQQVQLGATSSEIWDIVNSVTESMEDGDFTPIGFPVAPVTGPMDQSSNGTANNVATENIIAPPPNDEMPMVSRADVEREVDLPGLRAAALAADEAVEDSAQTLLNVLSSLDTTRRSARVAAETCLLSACNAQAESIKTLVRLERQHLEDRLQSLKELEEVVERVDVRQDLDLYVNADKKERGGSTWMGEYDDGGIASALAVLSSHVDGSMGGGLGTPSRSRLEWGVPSNDDEFEVQPEQLEDSVEELFHHNELFMPEHDGKEDATKAREEYQKVVDLLSKVASDLNPAARSRRSTICYALNSKRSNAELKSQIQFDGVSEVFKAILSGCDKEIGGIANAKMCMMLSQTFYKDSGDNDGETRSNRVYVKSRLIGHSLWAEEEFWDQALYQCVAESLTNSGVMQNFERSSDTDAGKSEWGPVNKLKWHDLNHAERSEAATQVHAVVFAQLGALAHSMMEFGCGIERSCNFVRRMSVRNQLPISQRTMLLQHLFGRQNDHGSPTTTNS